jgi:IS5 family transposase
MLCNHFMEQWFGLSDPAMEEPLRSKSLFRDFVQVDAGESRLPD